MYRIQLFTFIDAVTHREGLYEHHHFRGTKLCGANESK